DVCTTARRKWHYQCDRLIRELFVIGHCLRCSHQAKNHECTCSEPESLVHDMSPTGYVFMLFYSLGFSLNRCGNSKVLRWKLHLEMAAKHVRNKFVARTHAHNFHRFEIDKRCGPL